MFVEIVVIEDQKAQINGAISGRASCRQQSRLGHLLARLDMSSG